MDTKINGSPQFTLTEGTTAEIPPGQAVHLEETDGSATVYIRIGDTAQGLRTAMNQFLQVILDDGRWAQVWDADTHRLERPPKGLGLAEIEWWIAPDALLPRDVPCVPLEQEGRFVWAIRRGLASPEACIEMNRYFKRLAGDGLWVQRWHGMDPSPN